LNRKELKKYGLASDKDTQDISEISGEKVYRVIGYENTLVSTYDFVRNVTLPPGIWSISKATADGIFQLHVNQDLLDHNAESAKWCGELLQIQIYLKKEYNE